MTSLDRRQVLLAIAAIGAGAASPARAFMQVDEEGARRIGRAYLAGRPGLDARRLQAELLPAGWTPEAAGALRARARRDFRDGRHFIHDGWRLSDTEGRLFALASLTAS